MEAGYHLVLNMITKDGNKNRYSANASVGFLTAKAAAEGPIPGGSFIVTGRKSLFDNVLKRFRQLIRMLPSVFTICLLN